MGVRPRFTMNILKVDTRRLKSATVHASADYSIFLTRDYFFFHLLHSKLGENQTWVVIWELQNGGGVYAESFLLKIRIFRPSRPEKKSWKELSTQTKLRVVMYVQLWSRWHTHDLCIPSVEILLIKFFIEKEPHSQPEWSKREIEGELEKWESGQQTLPVYTCYQGRHTWPRAVLGAHIPPPPLLPHTLPNLCDF
jgi:hypothetical protein